MRLDTKTIIIIMYRFVRETSGFDVVGHLVPGNPLISHNFLETGDNHETHNQLLSGQL